MNTNRKSATIVGLLFIVATVFSILGTLVYIGPILDDSDYLTNVYANENQVLVGVLLKLIAAGAVAGTAIALFPIFRKHNEALALGYVGGRTIEAVFIIISAISALLLVTLGREYAAGAPDASNFQTLGTLLQAERDWTFLVGPNIVFSLNALMVSYLMYKMGLVPRFIAVWGLIGAPLILTLGLLYMFGLPRFSPVSVLLALPIASFEMVLAVYLIVKGFRSTAFTSETANLDMGELLTSPS